MPHPLSRFIRTIAILATLAAGIAGTQVSAQDSEGGISAGEQPIFIMPRSGPFLPQTIAIPNARVIAEWARSGHSEYSSEAFSHWNEDGEIRPVCSVCHSGVGFRSFHGLDGSEKGMPENPVPIGGLVDCDTCHNARIGEVTEVTLPSGVVHPVSGADAACATCHQGRSAGSDVIEDIAGKPDDAVDAELRFINPHYALGAALNLGSYGSAGYEYPGKIYSGRFLHARPVATCVSCHDPHSLEVSENTCLTCHFNGDPEEIRIARVSYDGSGNLTKGIRDDINANAALLLEFMQEYAEQVAGTALIYDGEHYPYFFADANGDGLTDQADGSNVRYNAWTPRLLKAAFNWKSITADAGVYAHNPHYALELLYDSIEDLAGQIGEDINALGLIR